MLMNNHNNFFINQYQNKVANILALYLMIKSIGGLKLKIGR